MKYVYFTKTLRGQDIKGLAAFCKEAGLDGVDLAVRPGYPVTPILSAGFALYIISQLPYSTFALFAVWLGVAAIIYFSYSARHSRLARGEAVATEEPE